MKVSSLGNLIGPVTPDNRILDFGQKLLNERTIRQHADHFHKRIARFAHDGKHRVSDRVFKPRADDAGLHGVIEFVHESDDGRDHKMFLLLGFCRQHIEPHRPLSIRGIKINHIFRPLRRDARHNAVDQISVRINDRHAMPGADILHDHFFKHLRFAGTGFSDGIHMPSAVIFAQIYGPLDPAVFRYTQKQSRRRYLSRSRRALRINPENMRRFYGFVG